MKLCLAYSDTTKDETLRSRKQKATEVIVYG